ncbi:MAG TPA: flagellar hook-length control protein FliK [Rhodospirillales bacterium]|nr:flagellar hook-length control protein FliK [Rhodospirillales bacterium]
MDDLLIKTNTVKNAATSGPNGRDSASALAGLAGPFQNLLNRAGDRIEDGFSIFADRTDLGAPAERADHVQPDDDYGRQQSDDPRDRFDDRGGSDNRADNSSDTPRAEKDNDYGREHGSEHRDDRGDVDDANHGESRGDVDDANQGESHAEDRGGDSAARDDTPTNDDQGDDQQVSSDDGDDGETYGKTSESDGETKTADNETENPDGAVQSAGTDGLVAQAGVSTETTDKVLSGLLAGGEALSEEGVASEQGKVSSADGQATALEAIAAASENASKTTPVSSGKSDGPQNHHQPQAAANASDQAKAAANEQSAIFGDDESGAAQTTVETQASGLAKAIGGDNRTQVSVTVTNEAQNLTSRPSAALTANTVISGEGSSQSSNSQSAGNHTQSGGNQNQAQQAQAAATQTQAAQNQSAQATQAGTGAKSLVQAQAMSGNAGSTAHSGGGEGAVQTGTGGVSGSQQTRGQNAVNQSGNTQNPARTGRSMVEQVTVKITKAIQAGNDKITIQLRPANMGRVEVKMEVSQDNRLNVHVIVDRPETLDQLQKDSRELQRALQEAGLHVDNEDLNFNLRGEENHAKEGDNSSGRAASVEDDVVLLDNEIIEQAVISSDGRVLSKGRIDVRA